MVVLAYLAFLAAGFASCALVSRHDLPYVAAAFIAVNLVILVAGGALMTPWRND